MKKITWMMFILSSSIIFLLNFTACTQQAEKDDIIGITEENDPTEYLESKGYILLTDIKKVDSKTISKDDLKGSFINGLKWSVQSFTPEKIIGKNVEYYCVDVKNHPLDKYLEHEDESIKVTIMKTDDKIIGGYSSINFKEIRYGANIYSIDGRTLEEFTGLDFQTWRESWDRKYK
ncbi:hypothetical protein [Acetivibrio cellulolyticus]|uniref:hypothetical protein n=1 Tax=Acetivibrio cellulolyticus TaxID=35830 RepID=UPI0001E305D4|nr:hypothetical protein [Acetivibrio cellulolyticus]